MRRTKKKKCRTSKTVTGKTKINNGGGTNGTPYYYGVSATPLTYRKTYFKWIFSTLVKLNQTIDFNNFPSQSLKYTTFPPDGQFG